jgi:hypothetical protein
MTAQLLPNEYVKVTLPDGHIFDAIAIMEHDIIMSPQETYPGFTSIHIPMKEHGKIFKDPDDATEIDMAYIEELILYALNDGGVKNDEWDSGLKFEMVETPQLQPENPVYVIENTMSPEDNPVFTHSKDAMIKFKTENPAAPFVAHKVPINTVTSTPLNHDAAMLYLAITSVQQKYGVGLTELGVLEKEVRNSIESSGLLNASAIINLIGRHEGINDIIGTVNTPQTISPFTSSPNHAGAKQTNNISLGDIDSHMPYVSPSVNIQKSAVKIIDKNVEKSGTLFSYDPSNYFEEKPMVNFALITQNTDGTMNIYRENEMFLILGQQPSLVNVIDKIEDEPHISPRIKNE